MKVAVLGAGGMLGTRVAEECERAGHDVLRVFRRHVQATRSRGMVLVADLRTPGALREVDRFDADWIVNCAGIVKSRADESPVDTVLVNSALPHWIEDCCGGKLLHVSTDCVFDGLRGDYEEHDPPSPVDLYAASKLAGESSHALVLRTSFIGWEPESRGLLSWLVAQQGVVPGYRRSLWSGLSAREVARVIAMVVADDPNYGSLYHLAGAPITKLDLLRLLIEKLGLELSVEEVPGPEVDRTLSSSSFRRDFEYQPPSWDEMGNELARERAT